MPITITSKRHLFRRCGIDHPKEPTQYPDGAFTEAELKALAADPMLTVKVTEAEPEPEPASKAKKKQR